MDDADRSVLLSEEVIAAGIARARKAIGSPTENASLVRDCAECGCLIPPARLVAVPGALLCVHCQTRAEWLRR
jgi:DnaK suppressor protein